MSTRLKYYRVPRKQSASGMFQLKSPKYQFALVSNRNHLSMNDAERRLLLLLEKMVEARGSETILVPELFLWADLIRQPSPTGVRSMWEWFTKTWFSPRPSNFVRVSQPQDQWLLLDDPLIRLGYAVQMEKSGFALTKGATAWRWSGSACYPQVLYSVLNCEIAPAKLGEWL